MNLKKHIVLLLSLLMLMASPLQAAMVSTPDLLLQTDREQLITLLEGEQVQQQLVEMGVDPQDAMARVQGMSAEELAQLNGQLAELPAGAGLSTVELILIIILIILLV